MLRRRSLLGCLLAITFVSAPLVGSPLASRARAQAPSPAAAPAAVAGSVANGPAVAEPPAEQAPASTANAINPQPSQAAPVSAPATEPLPGDHLAPAPETSTVSAGPVNDSVAPASAAGSTTGATIPSPAAAAGAVSTPAPDAAPSDAVPQDRVRELSTRSAATQREIENLVAKRNRIRLTGLNYARYVTWSAASAFALGSLLAFATAEDVNRDIKSGDYVGASDKDSDGDVDGDDKDHVRRISRTMGGASLVMAAGGVLSSIFYRQQLREMDQLTNDIETLRGRQKRAIFELDYELRASRQGARLGLIVRM